MTVHRMDNVGTENSDPGPFGSPLRTHHRPYKPSDRDACIELFHTNVPHFFRDHELQEFTEFLDGDGCEYVVVLADGEIVGCGGFGVRDGSNAADLCWGMVHRDHQGKGVGAYLLLARLHAIATTTEAGSVRLGTSQHTAGFFRRYGFETQSKKPDGIAPGLDEVGMKLYLTAENRTWIQRQWREVAASRH